jgi:aspartate aminotransferase-like enzyme
MITHNETSTGVTNDLETIAGIVKGEFDRLLLVDAVSSLAAIPLPVDGWRCDVVATASQKGWMVPPGLAFVSFSQRAWQALSEARMPRYFFDMAKAKSYYDRGQTPWTPTLSSMFATDLALDRLLSEGMPSVFQRHARIGQMTRDGVKALGLSLLPDEAIASNAVTAVNNPEGVDGARLLETLRVENNIVIAGGQGPLTGKIFRIGHMGYCEPQDIQDLLEALKLVLPTMGFKPAGVGARGD